MSGIFRVIVILFTLAIFANSGHAQSSVLAEGDWYKLSVKTNGVYKIDYSFLQNMGLNPDNIDPRRIKIYGNGSGMLPQDNNASRPEDLIENRILVAGEGDGKFNPVDYILFYAQSADSYAYTEGGILKYEHNIYTDYNFYFLTIGKNQGLRIEDTPDMGTGFPKITTYDCFQYYEKEAHNLLSSGREWYSEQFNFTTSYTYDFSFPELASDSELKITSAVMAQSFGPSAFKLSLNGILLGEQNISAVPDFRESVSRYSIKGKEDISQFTVNSDELTENTLSVNVTYEKNNSGQSLGFLNYLLVEASCRLILNDRYTIFRSFESTKNPSCTFEIAAATEQTMVWDISAPLAPLKQGFSLSGSIVSFGTTTSTFKEFVVFDVLKLGAPTFEKKIANQDIRSIHAPNMLIITHPDFLSEAQRLANFRKSFDNLQVSVVTTNQIYNEFSSGKQDVVAIRDYVKHLYDKGNELRYLLLFGRSSYDYKDILEENTNYVPIYESRNSLHPLNTYASDDFYGFLEDTEGAWIEEAGGNHTLDIGIGRLPVTTAEMAKNVVDKIIRYSTSGESLGAWRNDLLFVADDGDNNIHIRQSDQLSRLVDTSFSDFNPNKLYLDAFPQTSTPTGERSPKTRETLNQAVQEGALVVNFTGHGSEQVWMQEEILNISAIKAWSNTHRLPLFVTATCEFSRHDDPDQISGGEMILTNPNGGGIAIISTCRPVFSSSNFELNKALYSKVFSTENNEHLRLGDIIRSTKNMSIDEAKDNNKVGNRNFALLGDPSLRLNYPEKTVVITAINNDPVTSDTLKAMAKVKIDGEIRNSDGTKDVAFNGKLQVVIYDKDSKSTTLGNESAPYTYTMRENVLFRGMASIDGGAFSFEFVVPKNISYQPDHGKISFYALDDFRKKDANGSDIEMVVGGTANDVVPDNSGPLIDLFFGDSTSSGTGSVSSNTLLRARIRDENGINISGYGIGNNISAILDGKQTFILNDYYIASEDTYQEGWVTFPLNDLSTGKHTLTIKAWDTHNNPGKKTVEFIVVAPGNLTISRLINYPNPFHGRTKFTFEHNRSGDDLEVNLQIITRHGRVVKNLDFIINESTAHVDLWEWDGTNDYGQKFNAGIYLFKITVRSLADGAKNQRYEKLILIN